jgi:hypothetical protein
MRNRIICILWVVAGIAFWVSMAGCAKPTTLQALTEIRAVQETTADIGTHVDTARAGAVQATSIAKAIPAAAPVLPPLQIVTNELTAAHDEVVVLNRQVATVSDTSKTLADAKDKAEARAEKAEASATQWEKKYTSQWFAGKFWFWFTTISIIGGVALALLFVAEFALGLNIHPLTWIIKGIPWLVKFLINVIGNVLHSAKSAAAALVASFRHPAALQTVPPSGVIPAATPAAPPAPTP